MSKLTKKVIIIGVISTAIGIVGIALGWPTQYLSFFSLLGLLLFAIAAFLHLKTQSLGEKMGMILKSIQGRSDLLLILMVSVYFFIQIFIQKLPNFLTFMPTGYQSLNIFFIMTLILLGVYFWRFYKRLAHWYDILFWLGWLATGVTVRIVFDGESFAFLGGIFTIPIVAILFVIWGKVSFRGPYKKGSMESVEGVVETIVPLDRYPFQMKSSEQRSTGEKIDKINRDK